MIDIENPLPEGQRAPALLGGFLEEMRAKIDPISTTIRNVDSVTGGLAGLVVIGGGPGSGKTALAIQAAQNYAKEGGPVIYLAYEQGPAGFFHRIFQRISSKPTHKHREIIQSEERQTYVAELEKEINLMPYLQLEGLPAGGKGLDPEELKKNIAALQEVAGKRALVVVDSLHYTPLGLDSDRLDGKRYIDKSLRIFSELQQATKATVVCIAHQTKAEARDKDTGLMSFSGSGTIAYASDIAIQLVRNDNPADGSGWLDITIPKNRFGEVRITDPVRASYNLHNQTIG